MLLSSLLEQGLILIWDYPFLLAAKLFAHSGSFTALGDSARAR